MSAGKIPAGRPTSFVEMQSSGDLRLLQNSSLREVFTAYDQDAQSNREAWRTLRNETAMYLQPLYASVNLAVNLDGTLQTKIESYDLKALVFNPNSV